MSEMDVRTLAIVYTLAADADFKTITEIEALLRVNEFLYVASGDTQFLILRELFNEEREAHLELCTDEACPCKQGTNVTERRPALTLIQGGLS